MPKINLSQRESMLILDILRVFKDNMIDDSDNGGYKEDSDNWIVSISKDDMKLLSNAMDKIWEANIN